MFRRDISKFPFIWLGFKDLLPSVNGGKCAMFPVLEGSGSVTSVQLQQEANRTATSMGEGAQLCAVYFNILRSIAESWHTIDSTDHGTKTKYPAQSSCKSISN
jgi:hypothetical protein